MPDYIDRFDGERRSRFKTENCAAIAGSDAFLIHLGSRCVLLDAGYGFCARETADNIEKNLNGEALEAILLTHSHYDHCMGLAVIKKRFPNAEIICSERCAQILAKPSALKFMYLMDCGAAKLCNRAPTEPEPVMPRPDRTVADGETLRIGGFAIKALAFPGHTKCSFGYYFENERLLLASETTGSYAGELESFPCFLSDYSDTLASIDKALKLDIEELLIPHHGMLYSENARLFLENAKAATVEGFEAIGKLLKSGMSEEETVDALLLPKLGGKISKYYPAHAMRVNLTAQVKLVAGLLAES